MSVVENLLHDRAIMRVSVLDLDNTVFSARQTRGCPRKGACAQARVTSEEDRHLTEALPSRGAPTVLLIVSLLTMSMCASEEQTFKQSATA